MSDPRPVLREALELIEVGEHERAEALVQAAVRASEPGTAQRAVALSDLGTVCLAMGEPERAVGALREAARGEGLDPEARLSYLTHLGEVLAHLGEWEEAAQVLEEGVRGRAAHYGEEHPGYAYGLEPLAELLLRQGEVERAAALADEAAQVFWDSGHPRVAALLVLRSLAHKAAHGGDEPTLEAMDRLPAELWEEVVRQALLLAARHEAAQVVPMLLELRGRVIEARGASDPAATDLGIALTNAAREAGEHELRVRVFRDLVAALESTPRRHLEALLGLGLALSDTDEPEEALEIYQLAVASAEDLGDDCVLSTTLRNAGLYLADQEHLSAEAHLRQAVELAGRCGDEEVEARARVALGVFLQQRGEGAEAAALLRAGQEALPVGDPDALTAHAHLRALETGASQAHASLDASLSEALRAMVLPEAPEGLLDDITWGPEGVRVVLTREPSEEEVRALDRLVRHAVELTQGRMRAASTSRL